MATKNYSITISNTVGYVPAPLLYTIRCSISRTIIRIMNETVSMVVLFHWNCIRMKKMNKRMDGTTKKNANIGNFITNSKPFSGRSAKVISLYMLVLNKMVSSEALCGKTNYMKAKTVWVGGKKVIQKIKEERNVVVSTTSSFHLKRPKSG